MDTKLLTNTKRAFGTRRAQRTRPYARNAVGVGDEVELGKFMRREHVDAVEADIAVIIR
jgi:hypothetical protein